MCKPRHRLYGIITLDFWVDNSIVSQQPKVCTLFFRNEIKIIVIYIADRLIPIIYLDIYYIYLNLLKQRHWHTNKLLNNTTHSLILYIDCVVRYQCSGVCFESVSILLPLLYNGV